MMMMMHVSGFGPMSCILLIVGLLYAVGGRLGESCERWPQVATAHGASCEWNHERSRQHASRLVCAYSRTWVYYALRRPAAIFVTL